jgi:hypothetical protein
LRFAGNRLELPPTTVWRAFISPADTAGNQSIWFSNLPTAGKLASAVLGMVINSRSGILHAFGSENSSYVNIPIAPGLGQLVTVSVGDGESMVLLEVPFDFGRWRLQTALSFHWTLTPPRPLPGEYRLYNDLIWQFEPPSVDPALVDIFERDISQGRATGGEEDSQTMTSKLFEHPAMGSWVFQVGAGFQTPHPADQFDDELPTEEFLALIMRELEKRAEGGKFSAAMAEGLRAQAAWLYLSGNTDLAAYAQILAAQVTSLPPSRNPVLTYMIQASLHQTGNDTKSG